MNSHCLLKYAFLVLLAIILVATDARSQILSTDGNFQVDFNEGCAPFQVEITSNVPCECNLYFDGGRGNPPDDIIEVGETGYTHIYTTPGTYNFILIGNSLGRDSLTITVHPNNPPEFTATVCANREISVDITDNNYDTFTIDYGDGSPIVPITTGLHQYTYTTTGNYTVEVKGFYSGSGARPDSCSPGRTSVQAVTVLNDATIDSLTLTSTHEARLRYTLSPDTRYGLEIQINNDRVSSFVSFMNDISGDMLTINNMGINFEENYYCFRIVTIDPCNNTKTYSNTLCSIDLDDIEVNDLSNRVNINSSANGLTSPPGHTIQLWNEETQSFAIRQTLPSSTSFDDNSVVCNIEYCYRVQSTYGSAVSTSLTKCATALSLRTPSTIDDISIDATSEPILFWRNPSSFVADIYQIYLSDKSIGTSVTNNYTDLSTDAGNAPACYQISYTDECGNDSELSNVVCSIFLSSIRSGDITSLQWTPYEGWVDGVSAYQVIKNGEEGNPVYTGTALTYTPASVQDEQQTLYQVIAIPNADELDMAKSNIMSITNRSNITFPTAFVVNGTNNEFKVVGRYIVGLDLKIYTRWGELVAHITDHNTGWDGTRNGKELPEGNYIYSAEIKDEANNLHQRNGTVLLLRK